MTVQYTRMTIITRRDKQTVLEDALLQLGVEGMTVTEVVGNGTQNGQIEYTDSDGQVRILLIPKIYVELVTTTQKAAEILKTILPLLKTGLVGDGKIFLENSIKEVYTVRTGQVTRQMDHAGSSPDDGEERSGPESEVFLMSEPIKAMTKITIVTRKEKLKELRRKLVEIGVTGMTVTEVNGCGRQHGVTKFVEGITQHAALLPKVKVEIIVCAVPASKVIEAAGSVLHTGNIGDGKIFTSPITHAIRIRTGETDSAAI